MKFRRILFATVMMIGAVAFSSCDVVKQAGGAYTMTQCKYDYNSITNLSVSGIDISKGISLTQIPKITSILTGSSKSIPLNFTLNLNVTNPNQTAAMLNGLQYIISVDDIDFTSGSLDKSLNIAAGSKEVLPLTIGLDLASLMQSNSKDAVLGIAKNFIGMGDKESKVTLQLRPSFLVGGNTLTSPIYIPVSFSFGGKN